MTVILAIANHNGGVGKTVTAANVSAGLAQHYLSRFSVIAVVGVSAADQHAPPCHKEAPPMKLWDQLGGAGLRREADHDAWLAQHAEAPAWWHANWHRGRSPNHPTPYLDLIIPPCAAICFLISMYAVLGIGLDWHSDNWRGDLLILLLAVGLPLMLLALRHGLRWRA